MTLENKCPLCGKLNPLTEWVCEDCGAQLPMHGRRDVGPNGPLPPPVKPKPATPATSKDLSSKNVTGRYTALPVEPDEAANAPRAQVTRTVSGSVSQNLSSYEESNEGGGNNQAATTADPLAGCGNSCLWGCVTFFVLFVLLPFSCSVLTTATAPPTPTPTPYVWPTPTATSVNDPCASGATAICSDGSKSFSNSRRGTCSHHGGVAYWCN